jgi:hypothetical protein
VVALAVGTSFVLPARGAPRDVAAVPVRDKANACIAAAERAQPLRRDGKLALARPELALCARPVCPDFVRADCVRWLAEVDAQQPSVRVDARTPTGESVRDVRVVVDGKELTRRLADPPLVLLDPGRHQLRFERAGSEAVEDDVTLRLGDQEVRVAVTFMPEGAGKSRGVVVPLAGWITGGAGVLAIGAASTLWILGRNEHASLAATCAPSHACTEAAVDSARTKLVVGDVAFGAGLVTLGVAAYLVVRATDAPRYLASIEPVVLPGGGALRVQGHF